VIACQPDEPRYVGPQDVFRLQDKVIEHILGNERQMEAKAAAPMAVDPIQQTVAEELKDAIRRRTVDRDRAKRCLAFLGQPMGKALHNKLREAYDNWYETKGDAALLGTVAELAERFGKDRPASPVSQKRLTADELELICFEYVTG